MISESTIIYVTLMGILLSIIWIIRYFFSEKYILNVILTKKFKSLNWTKFIIIYVIIQAIIIFNNKLSLLDIVIIPFMIMLSLFSMYMCNYSIEEITDVRSDPNFEINKKIWDRNKKLNKLL